jgi:hypothetical protein
MDILAMFKVERITIWESCGEVILEPVKSGSDENKQSLKFMPADQIKMTIDNLPALEVFKPGRIFYVTFQPAASSLAAGAAGKKGAILL